MDSDRLRAQIGFLVEADRLKGVVRRNPAAGGARWENSAEHSWHVALMALVLAEHANAPVDRLRVLSMLLVHDLVEIDAGDTFAYDATATATQEERETRAADRIFALLPPDQAAGLRALWDEFQAQATPEARFAAAVDRLAPLLLNYHSGGKGWQEHGVVQEQVLASNRPISGGAATLWTLAQELIADAVGQGFLAAEQVDENKAP